MQKHRQLNHKSYSELDHNFDGKYECNDGILLEPRLQEYLKKKSYFKKNHIKPDVNPEQEFSINEQDVKRLRAFMKGDKDLYNYKTQQRFDFDETEQPKFEFDPDEVYKSDIRYQRFAKKMKRDKEAMKQRHCYGDMDEDYKRAFSQPDIGKWNDNRITDQRVSDERMMFMKDESPESIYKCDVPINPKRNYKNKQKMIPIDREIEVNPRINSIIGQLDSYRTKPKPNYERTSEMDTDMKMVIPNVRNNKKILNSSSYRSIPFVGRGGDLRDIAKEDHLRYSEPTHLSKSFGYPNATEHYFDYIDSDIQDPDHVVFERGTNTRLANRQVARQYKREILN